MPKNKKETDLPEINMEGIESPESHGFNISNSESTDLSEEQLQRVANEAKLEQEYGDAPIQTFAESAASGATFGLSDQALVKLNLTTPEALRERRERNETAAIAGEITGVVAPALASGGTSIVAKGLGKAGAAVVGAGKAGLLAEKAAAKTMQKILKDTGKHKFAAEVIRKSIPKTAGSAVEGAFYGAGQLISEDALERAELNAENLLSSVGTGALIGGVAGGIFGTAEALVPIVKNNKVVDYVSKKVKTSINKENAALQYSGFSPSKALKIKETKPHVYENMPNFYKNNIKLKHLDSDTTVYNKVKQSITDIGDDIGKTLDDIDNSIVSKEAMPVKSEVAKNIQTNLKSFIDEFEGLPSSAAKRNLAKVRRELAQWDDWAIKPERMTGKDLHKLKVKLQKLAKWERKFDSISLDEKMARSTSEAVRQELMKLADNVSTTDNALGTRLRQQNLDYATAVEIAPALKVKINKKDAKGVSDLLSVKDILVGVGTTGAGLPGVGVAAIAARKFIESDFRRKLSILASVEKRNQQVKRKINSSVSNFFKGTKKIAVPASTKILLKSGFSTPNKEKGDKKPKNRLEAFNQVSKNISRIKENPDALLETVFRQTNRLDKIAPKTSQALEVSIGRAIQFLEQKLPKNPNDQTALTIIKSKWQPSDADLAKFERYLEAVESPLSILDDLESGSVSREAAEALRNVYPELYVEVQSKILDNIAEDPESLTYQQRLQLGTVFDIPTDLSLLPQNIAGLQANFDEEAEAEAKAESQNTNLRAKGLDNLSIASNEATSTQVTATRKSRS